MMKHVKLVISFDSHYIYLGMPRTPLLRCLSSIIFFTSQKFLSSSCRYSHILTTTISSSAAWVLHRARASERVLRKRSSKCLLAADLLATNKALDCNGDGAVDIGGTAVIGQTHLGERLGDTKNRFQMTDLFGVRIFGRSRFQGLDLL